MNVKRINFGNFIALLYCVNFQALSSLGNIFYSILYKNEEQCFLHKQYNQKVCNNLLVIRHYG